MLPEQVSSLYEKLKTTINNFSSPAFRAYFLRKAQNDFDNTQMANGEQRVCAMKKYLSDQGELLDVLKRQTVIYNMFRDENSQV